MQIIGDDNLVVIKYDFFKQDDEYTIAEKEKWLFGHLCFIVDSVCIGNNTEWTSFTVVKNYLPVFMENYENRFVEESVFNLPQNELFDIYYEQFYNDSSVSEILPMEMNDFAFIRDTFHLDEIGESSFRDKIGMLLFNFGKQQKIVWKDFGTNEVFCKILPEGYVDDLLKDLYSSIMDEMSKSRM